MYKIINQSESVLIGRLYISDIKVWNGCEYEITPNYLISKNFMKGS